jgi:hypothetical protein
VPRCQEVRAAELAPEGADRPEANAGKLSPLKIISWVCDLR